MSMVIGVGNALVDVLVRLDNDQALETMGFPKGSMQLVDLTTSNSMLDLLKHLPSELAAGGSAANTINGLAKLGVKTRFVGKIGNDGFGDNFLNDQISNGIQPFLMKADQPTGRAVAMISPDKERTFGTYLGAAMFLNADDLQPDMFRDCSVLHLEGFLVINHDLVIRAAHLAREHGLKISLDLASYNVVEANLDFLKSYIAEFVDILFANEEEARAYTGLDPEQSLERMAGEVNIAVVKLGPGGSMAEQGNTRVRTHAVPAHPIDTTGAGDLYAAGFLYGMLRGQDLKTCIETGSLIAGHVIEVFGSKLDSARWEKIEERLRS